MTYPNNTPIDTTIDQTPLNAAGTDATVITAVTIAASTSTSVPVGIVTDETTSRSLFGAGLYQMGSILGTTSAPVAVPTPPAVPGMITQGFLTTR